jgi:2',3'-cyclic-nucleotide 2'-phosphodiesterase (5'-nucleotidase family)
MQVPPMNQLGVDASCIGNHDFDFGVPTLKLLIRSTNFPWVLSNIIDHEVGGPAAGQKFIVLERSGMKIGILGLVEKYMFPMNIGFVPLRHLAN